MATLPLTFAQVELAQFMLCNGGPEAESYLSQLEKAEATDWRCPCGCASFNFKINGYPEAPPSVHVLSEFLFGPTEAPVGIFIYSCDGILSGVEVYGLGGDAPSDLPSVSELRPYT